MFLEHRNIPIDDAIYLINKNYESYKNGEQSKVGAISTVPKTEKHPEPIQVRIISRYISKLKNELNGYIIVKILIKLCGKLKKK